MGPRARGTRDSPLVEAFLFCFVFFKLEYSKAMPQNFTGKIMSNVELFMQANYQSSVS